MRRYLKDIKPMVPSNLITMYRSKSSVDELGPFFVAYLVSTDHTVLMLLYAVNFLAIDFITTSNLTMSNESNFIELI